MEKEFNQNEMYYQYTDEVTCPSCLYEYGDSWEFPNEGNQICDNCGCEFTFERDVVVTYSSKLIKNNQ